MPMTNAAEYLERTAARVPDKIAFSDASGSLTFGQLLTRARALGTVLAGLPGCKNAPVAVLTGRTVQSVAALQGVLQSGNYYVPIDEQMPEARMRRILAQVHARAIVFSESSRPQAERLTDCAPLVCLEEAEKTAPDDALLQAQREQIIDLDPVYLLFTSGSTGTPKGIVISHRAILDFTDWLTDFCGYTEHEVFGNQSLSDAAEKSADKPTDVRVTIAVLLLQILHYFHPCFPYAQSKGGLRVSQLKAQARRAAETRPAGLFL